MAQERPRTFMISDLDVVRTLMAIVEAHRNYAQQLEIFAKCLANAFVYAKKDDSMFSLQKQGTGIVADRAHEYAIVLARTLSDVATTNRIRVVLYLLTVIRQICRTTVAEEMAEKEGRVQGSTVARDKVYQRDAERRFNILRALATTDVAFDRVLTTVLQNSRAWEKDAVFKLSEHRSKRADARMDGPTDDKDHDDMTDATEEEKEAKQRESEIKGNVKALQDIVDWFKRYISDAASQHVGWNYEAWARKTRENERHAMQAQADLVPRVDRVDSASESGASSAQ
jgi:hypothetical protein